MDSTVATAMASALPNDLPATQDESTDEPQDFPQIIFKTEPDSESDSYDDSGSATDSDSDSDIVPVGSREEDNVVLSCTFCTAQSSNHHRMLQHVKEHTVDRPWSCMKCHFQAIGRQFSMLRHSSHCLDYVELVRSCDDCHLERLDNALGAGDTHRCTICTFSSPSLLKVMRHIEGHVRRKTSASSDSDEDIGRLIARGRPLRPARPQLEVPKLRPYCQKCGYDCSCSKVSTQQQRIKCVDCYVDCGNVQDYVAHMRRSHPNGRYKCNLCPKMYVRSENFANHMRTHEGNLQCMFCDYFAPNEIRLRAHVRTHSHLHLKRNGVKRPNVVVDTFFYCPLCNVRSSNYNYVVSHCRRHVLTVPYECKKCRKRFTNAADLSDHCVNHIDQNSIMCESCNKTFACSDDLRVHKITFHGETRVFSCVTCGAKFGRLSDLESHQLSHQEKPFMCDLCGREFNQLSNLKSHKIANHGNE